MSNFVIVLSLENNYVLKQLLLFNKFAFLDVYCHFSNPLGNYFVYELCCNKIFVIEIVGSALNNYNPKIGNTIDSAWRFITCCAVILLYFGTSGLFAIMMKVLVHTNWKKLKNEHCTRNDHVECTIEIAEASGDLQWIMAVLPLLVDWSTYFWINRNRTIKKWLYKLIIVNLSSIECTFCLLHCEIRGHLCPFFMLFLPQYLLELLQFVRDALFQKVFKLSS